MKTCIRLIGRPCLVALGFVALIASAQNQPYQGTPFPVPPAPGAIVPTPLQVTGKEFLDMPNRNVMNVPVTGQVIAWDGLGGTMNSFTYGVSQHADAIANQKDALFQAVIFNSAALLISVTGDSPQNSVWYENIFGGTGVWATKAQIDAVFGVQDLDGLEVWGQDALDDSDRFSLLGDPGQWAVYAFSPMIGGFSGYISKLTIANAIGHPELEPVLDLDALMTLDDGDDLFEPDDTILFSIRPVGPFDGGEVWVLNGGGGPAAFLNHGGHLWDTAFDVKGTFGVQNENVDALEAVATPEPGTFALLTISLFALSLTRSRSLRRPA